MNAAAQERTAYINARLIDPARGLDVAGGVLVRDGRILDAGADLFGAGVPSGVRTVDCGGHCLAPGLIDIRVHLPQPAGVHRDTLATAGAAAAASGITSMVCLPDTDPPVDNLAVADSIARRARDTGSVKVYSYGTVTRKRGGAELTEFGTLKDAGVLAFTDGDRAIGDARVMRRALSYAATFDALIVQHPEDPDLALGGCMNEGVVATRLGLAGIPAAAEAIVIERDLRLVELTGARYHVAHVSTAEAVRAIRAARDRGIAVTCDTAPHYFMLNDEAVMDYRTFAKVSPPLRADADRRAVIDGLCDGTIDVIASDHRPHNEDAKRQPFAQAADGIVGIETMLPLALEMGREAGIALVDLLGRMTAAPGRLMGLEQGQLVPGRPADFFVFDPDAAWRIDVDGLRTASRNSPFDGFAARGRVLLTVIDGRAVHEAPRERAGAPPP